MPVYEYKGFDRAGKNKKGIIDADSAITARQRLRGSGVFTIDIKEALSRQKGLPHSSALSNFFKRVKSGELSAATRQLSILLGAGVPLVSSLDTLMTQAANPLFKKILAQVKESVNEGGSFASSLSQHPKVFSEVYINMVRAGESSGSLDLVLDRLADFSERQQALRGRFKAAMAYPVLMFFVGSLILFFLITFIIPDILAIFGEMHKTLPLPTLILIGISSFLESFWWIVIFILAGTVFLIKRAIRNPSGRYFWDNVKLRIPVFGSINIKMAMARFARTLGSLLKNGVPLLNALKIVRNIVNNTQIAKAIDNAMDQIEAGKSLSTQLGQSRWFPPIAVQMISVGEQSGELEEMLNKIADIYEREAESQVMAMTSMLEPIMILVMGVIVGFIVISILLPIFEMNQMIR